MSNTHSQSQAKVTNMSKSVFRDKIMTKTLSKSHFSGSIFFKSLIMFKTDSKSQL